MINEIHTYKGFEFYKHCEENPDYNFRHDKDAKRAFVDLFESELNECGFKTLMNETRIYYHNEKLRNSIGFGTIISRIYSLAQNRAEEHFDTIVPRVYDLLPYRVNDAMEIRFYGKNNAGRSTFVAGYDSFKNHLLLRDVCHNKNYLDDPEIINMIRSIFEKIKAIRNLDHLEFPTIEEEFNVKNGFIVIDNKVFEIRHVDSIPMIDMETELKLIKERCKTVYAGALKNIEWNYKEQLNAVRRDFEENNTTIPIKLLKRPLLNQLAGDKFITRFIILDNEDRGEEDIRINITTPPIKKLQVNKVLGFDNILRELNDEDCYLLENFSITFGFFLRTGVLFDIRMLNVKDNKPIIDSLHSDDTGWLCTGDWDMRKLTLDVSIESFMVEYDKIINMLSIININSLASGIRSEKMNIMLDAFIKNYKYEGLPVAGSVVSTVEDQ